MPLDTTFEFPGAVREFHVYRDIWRPFEEELLKFDFEIMNPFDMFAIEIKKSFDHDKTTGHVSHGISRPTTHLDIPKTLKNQLLLDS